MSPSRSHPPASRPVQRAPRVLLVDDDPPVLRTLVRVLRQRRPDWDVTAAQNAFVAADLMRARTFDVLITDLNMPGASGRDLLEHAAHNYPGTLRVIHSACVDNLGGESAIAISHLVLHKPLRPESFVSAIEAVLAPDAGTLASEA